MTRKLIYQLAERIKWLACNTGSLGDSQAVLSSRLPSGGCYYTYAMRISSWTSLWKRTRGFSKNDQNCHFYSLYISKIS